MTTRASSSIRLTRAQVRCGNSVKRDLQNERTNYLRMMQTLLASANNVCESNEVLKAAVIERQQQLNEIRMQVEKGTEKMKAANKKLRMATQRYKKYQRQISTQTRGMSVAKIHSEIEQLKSELAAMKGESVDTKAKVDDEKKVVEEIVKLNNLKRELVEMNTKLKDLAERLLKGIDLANVSADDDLLHLLEKLQMTLETSAKLKEEFNIRNPEFDAYEDSDVFDRLDARLKATVPIFQELERLFEPHARTSQMSRLTSGQMSEFCSEILKSDRFRSSVLSSIRATTAPGMRVSPLDFATGEMWNARSIRSSMAPVSLEEFCDEGNSRRKMGLVQMKRRPLSADQAKVINMLFLASRSETASADKGRRSGKRPESVQARVRPVQAGRRTKRSFSDVEASLNAMTTILHDGDSRRSELRVTKVLSENTESEKKKEERQTASRNRRRGKSASQKKRPQTANDAEGKRGKSRHGKRKSRSAKGKRNNNVPEKDVIRKKKEKSDEVLTTDEPSADSDHEPKKPAAVQEPIPDDTKEKGSDHEKQADTHKGDEDEEMDLVDLDQDIEEAASESEDSPAIESSNTEKKHTKKRKHGHKKDNEKKHKKDVKHDKDGGKKSVIRHRKDSNEDENVSKQKRTLRRRKPLLSESEQLNKQRDCKSDSDVYHSPDRKKLTPTSMKQRTLWSLSASFSDEVSPHKPAAKDESLAEISDSEDAKPKITLENADNLFATETSASPQKLGNESEECDALVEHNRAVSTEILVTPKKQLDPKESTGKHVKMERSQTVGTGAFPLEPRKFKVALKDISIALYDSSGEPIRDPVKIDETGAVRGRNIYDADGNKVENLKEFIPHFAKSVSTTKKIHEKKRKNESRIDHRKHPPAPEKETKTELPKKEKPRKSRLGKKVDGLPIFKYKSKYAEKIAKQNEERAKLPRVPSFESLTSASPIKAPSELHIGNGKFIQVYDEFDEDGQPTRTSRVAWARALLRRAITSQLSRTERAMAVSDAQLALCDLEEEIQDLNEENEREKQREEYVPVLAVENVVEDEYLSCELKVVKKEDKQSNSEMTMMKLDEVQGEISSLNEEIAVDYVSNQKRMIAQKELPRLESWLEHLQATNKQNQKVINTLQARLNLINSNDGCTRETIMRREFEAAMDTRNHTISEVDSEIANGEEQMEELQSRIEEQKFMHEKLKKQISVAQREPKPDLMKICIDMDNLRATSRQSKEKLKQAEIEMSFYDETMRKKRGMISEDGTKDLQENIATLREKLQSHKQHFTNRMRKDATTSRTVPYTNVAELSRMSARTNEISRQLSNLKRKEDFVRHKIAKMEKTLESFDVRVPTQ